MRLMKAYAMGNLWTRENYSIEDTKMIIEYTQHFWNNDWYWIYSKQTELAANISFFYKVYLDTLQTCEVYGDGHIT